MTTPDPWYRFAHCGQQKLRSGPVSRVLSWATISLGRRLLVGSSNLPGRVTRRTASRRDPVSSITNFALLGLASGGVCRAEPVTRPAGALLPHRFTLTSLQPSLAGARNDRRFTFCGTVPVLANGGRYPPPRPVKPGLSSASLHNVRLAAIAQPTPRANCTTILTQWEVTGSDPETLTTDPSDFFTSQLRFPRC